MRDSLVRVIQELEGVDDATRVQAAGVLQDELREAMGMVAAIRSAAAKAAVAGHGLSEAARLADLDPGRLQAVALGGGR